jgi:hypothetical protein
MITPKSRTHVPAEIRRAVLVESGHRCAIPRCEHRDVDIHHIIPWEICGRHEYKNLISLCPNCHRRAHKGEIDRKSLQLYKEALVAAFQTAGDALFSAPAVEIKRRIYEVESACADCIFSFEFPDLLDPIARMASKNIEAWGLELLAIFRQSQDSEYRGFPIRQDYPICWLTGSYEVVRRDAQIISVRYDIEMMAFRAAHRARETRVQNFLVDPFTPLLLEDLLASPEAIESLAKVVKKKLLLLGLSEADVEIGTDPSCGNFSRFIVDQFGFNFMFDEYEVAPYALGQQAAYIEFNELNGVFKSEILSVLDGSDC